MAILTAGTFHEADLSTDDVDTYTGGQLASGDDETLAMLNAALAAARNDMRWHVAPVMFAETISLDGPGTNKLRLPTKSPVTIHSITSDGVAVDPNTDVVPSAESPNLLLLKNGVWSNQYSGITVTWDHGFTNAQAADWRNAVLALVVNIAQISVAGRSDSELASKQIDDVTYRWAAAHELGAIEPSIAKYRLLYMWV